MTGEIENEFIPKPEASNREDNFETWLNPSLSPEDILSFGTTLDWSDETVEGSDEKVYRLIIMKPDTNIKTGLVVKESLTSERYEIVIEDQPNGEGTKPQYETVSSDANPRKVYGHLKDIGLNSWPIQ